MKYAPISVLIILALGVAAVTIYRPHGRPRVHSIGPAVYLASDFSPSVRCLLTRSRLMRLKMDMFDYNASAELFTGRLRMSRTRSVGYKRFAHAVDAVRFAIEELPAQSLAGASLEVGEDRFNAEGIRRLHEHTGYPLWREPSARTPKGPDAGLEHDPAQRTKAVSWRQP